VAAGKKRGRARDGATSSSDGGKGRRPQLRRKSCFFCKEKVTWIDYKNVAQLRRFITERGRIRSRGLTGACRKHQAQVATAIKRAREMALLPYVADAAPPAHRPRQHDDR
jgi:small subunit ribosomal protein S18